MVLCPIKRRRTTKGRQIQSHTSSRPARIDSVIASCVATSRAGDCGRRRDRRVRAAAFAFTTCVSVTQGFELASFASRRCFQLWEPRTRYINPHEPLHVQLQAWASVPSSLRNSAHENDNHDDPGTNEELEGTSWKVGNVQQDFWNLEQAIALSMADQYLQQQERMEMLDYFASQRKPLFHTVRSNLLAPLGMSFLLTSLARAMPVPWETLLLRLMGTVFDVHFWLSYVAIPSIFLAVLRRKSLKTARETQQLSVFGEERSVDPSLGHPVVCLLEQWLSASLGMLAAVPFFVGPWHNERVVSGLCVLTKVSVYASLHQFPILYYRAFRPHQPRPIAWKIWFLSWMVQTLWLPWSLVPDLMRLGLCWSWPQAALAHVVVGAAIAFVTYGMPMRLSANHPRPVIPRPKLLVTVLAVAATMQRSHSVRRACSCLVRAVARKDVSSDDVWDAAQTLVRPIIILLASVGPCIHLGAFRRLLRVSNCDGISLADLQDCGMRLQNTTSAGDPQKMWRWRLQWREPRRVADILKQWRRSFFYWLFLKGTVQEKVRRELDNKRRGGKHGLAHQRGLTVLQRMARDRAREREWGLPPPDRTQWKQEAMDRLARVHEKDYERNDLQDLLGIAVYKALGIGLGFSFDYMSKLPPGVKPSTRRLQARAAKSAIRRVQQIYDADRARRELEDITDPIERDRRARELRERDQREVEEMATKLSNLVPLDMKLDIPGKSRMQDYYWDDRLGAQSPLLQRRLRRQDASQAIEQLSDQYGDDTVRNATSAVPIGDDDSEFITAWERQRYGRYGDGGDGNSTTVTALA